MYQVVVCCIHPLNEMQCSCCTDLVLNLEASVVISLQVLQCLRQVCHSNRQMDFCRRKKHKEQCTTTTELKRDRKKVLLHLPLYYLLAQLKLLHTTVLQHSADILLLSLATHAPQRTPSSASYSQTSTGHCSDVPNYQVTFLGLCFISFEACLLFIVQSHEHRYSTPLSSQDGRAE